MQDLKLNSNFSVHLDDRNDLATVSGREAFEQSIVMMLTDFMYGTVLGLSSRENIKERINLEVTRVAREHDLLDSIEYISINEKLGESDTFEVRVSYSSTDEAEFEEDITVQ